MLAIWELDVWKESLLKKNVNLSELILFHIMCLKNRLQSTKYLVHAILVDIYVTRPILDLK